VNLDLRCHTFARRKVPKQTESATPPESRMLRAAKQQLEKVPINIRKMAQTVAQSWGSNAMPLRYNVLKILGLYAQAQA